MARANRAGPGLGARLDLLILAISVTASIPLFSEEVMHRLTAATFSRVSFAFRGVVAAALGPQDEEPPEPGHVIHRVGVAAGAVGDLPLGLRGGVSRA